MAISLLRRISSPLCRENDAAITSPFSTHTTTFSHSWRCPTLRWVRGQRRVRRHSVRLRILKPPGDAGAGLEGKYPLYRDIVEFGTTYDIVFHTQSALETAGSQTRFFVVGRNRTPGHLADPQYRHRPLTVTP
jgi:hypothetical protein